MGSLHLTNVVESECKVEMSKNCRIAGTQLSQNCRPADPKVKTSTSNSLWTFANWRKTQRAGSAEFKVKLHSQKSDFILSQQWLEPIRIMKQFLSQRSILFINATLHFSCVLVFSGFLKPTKGRFQLLFGEFLVRRGAPPPITRWRYFFADLGGTLAPIWNIRHFDPR